MLVSKIRDTRLLWLLIFAVVLTLVFSFPATTSVSAEDTSPSFTITVTYNSSYGTVHYGAVGGPLATTIIVAQGSSHTFFMNPASNCIVADVLVDGVSAGVLSQYTFSNVQKDYNLAVIFEVFDDSCLLPTTTPTTTTRSPSDFVLSADLSITNEPSSSPVKAGDTLTYNITMNNAGPDRADFPVINDSIPAGATFVNAMGKGWTYNLDGSILTFYLHDFLKTGTSATISYTIQVPGQSGVITSIPNIKSDSQDPNPANNTAQVSVEVISVNSPVTTTTVAGDGIGTIVTTPATTLGYMSPAPPDTTTGEGSTPAVAPETTSITPDNAIVSPQTSTTGEENVQFVPLGTTTTSPIPNILGFNIWPVLIGIIAAVGLLFVIILLVRRHRV
jgi:uncharacterized repeat protein (TIGR01451 family)